MVNRRLAVCACAALLALGAACGRQTATPVSPSAGGGMTDANADGSTLKATAPAPTSPINDQALSDAPVLTAAAATMKFGGPLVNQLVYRFQVFNEAGQQIVDSGQQSTPAYRVTQALDFKKRYTWHVRAEFKTDVGPWSSLASFVSPEGGYLRGNEVFDPLSNGISVGQAVGPVTFLPNQGVRLDTNLSHIRYLIPQTITAGEFSMEVTGLRANNSGDKSKVFSMASGAPDFITDPYRVDIQYRGTAGFPPNAVTYRVLYGSADDLDLRYEPDTATRLNSVLNLDPNKMYFWKFTWGSGEVRLVVQEGGAKDNGRVLYNVGVRARNGSYNPTPHIAYLGAPAGRSGVESASVPGAIFRNVWIGARSRP
jgi:hypothetical protein